MLDFLKTEDRADEVQTSERAAAFGEDAAEELEISAGAREVASSADEIGEIGEIGEAGEFGGDGDGDGGDGGDD